MPVYGQIGQPKEFHVNAYRILKKGDERKPEPLCKGFNVLITDEEVNIGDDFDLQVTEKKHYPTKRQTYYWVDDQATSRKVCLVILLTGEGGDNYVQIHPCDANGEFQYDGGMIFEYIDYVSDYDLWRYMRSNY